MKWSRDRLRRRFVAVFFVVWSLLFALGAEAAPLSWTTKAPMLTPRSRGASAAINGLVYVIGGITDDGASSAVESYDPVTDVWHVRPPLLEPRYAAASAVQGDIVFLAGGSGAAGADTKITSYDVSTGATIDVGSLKTGRMRASAAILGTSMYIVGGRGSAVIDSVEVYDLVSRSTAYKTTLPAPRELASVAAFQGKLFIIGGLDPSGLPGNNCWLYDPDTNTFASKAPLPVPVGARLTVAANNRIYLVGGVTSFNTTFTSINDIQEYDPVTDSWRILGPFPTSRYSQVAEVVNNTLYVIGGDLNPPGSPPSSSATNEAALFDSDVLPPATGIVLSGTAGTNGWYVSDVRVSLSAADNPGGVGVAASEFSFDGSNWNSYAGEFVISAEGTATLFYRSRDNAGNVEPAHEQQIRIDKTAPDTTITGKPADPSPAVSGAVAFSSDDPGTTFLCSLDGLTPIQCQSPFTLAPLGAGQHTFTVRAIDAAGNSDPTPVSCIWTVQAETTSWSTGAPLPLPVSRAGSAAVEGRIYILGGSTGTGAATDAVQMYDPHFNSWQTKSPLCHPVFGAGTAAQGGIIYLAGGNAMPSGLTSSVIAYNTVDGTCRQAGSLQTPRSRVNAAMVNGMMYVVGGDGAGGTIDTIEAFDPATGTSTVKISLPEPRGLAGVVSLGTKIYVMGGSNNGLFANTCWEYDPALNTLAPRAAMPVAVEARAAVSLNGKIYVLGGWGQGGISTLIQEYDPVADIWHIVGNIPTTRYADMGEMVDGAIYIIGGDNGQGGMLGTNEAWITGIAPLPTGPWSVHSVYSLVPGVIDWEASQHPPVSSGNYLLIDGVYYYVIDSQPGTWNSAVSGQYNMARLQKCDQATGAPLFDPMNPANPLHPDVWGTIGKTIQLFYSWPGFHGTAPWQVNSINPEDAGRIDWRAEQHAPVMFGKFLKVAGIFYYVSMSGSGSWSGQAFNSANLLQCNQVTGKVLFDPANPVAPLRANLTGMVGQQISLHDSPIQGGMYVIDATAVGNGTISCTSPVLAGGNAVCTVQPSPGNVLYQLLDNGFYATEKVTGATYTIYGVSAYHQVSAEFRQKPYLQLSFRFVESGTNKITVDGQGNVYVIGDSYGPLDGTRNAGSYDAFVRKYAATGAWLWTRQIGTAGNDLGKSIVVDAYGDVFIFGDTEGNLDGNTNSGINDFFLIKLDTNGNKLWSRQFGSTSFEYAAGLALDGDGNVYVTGTTQGIVAGSTLNGNGDLILAKFSTNGEQLWLRQLGQANQTRPNSITVDASGSIYVGGGAGGSIDGATFAGGAFDFLLLKYDSGGNKIWSREFGTNIDDTAPGVVTDTLGNIYAISEHSQVVPSGTGYVMQTSAAVVKFDPSGTTIWSHDLEFTATAIAMGHDGNIYLSGVNGRTLTLLVFDRNGNRILNQAVTTLDDNMGSQKVLMAVTDKVYLINNGMFIVLGNPAAPNGTSLYSSIASPTDGSSYRDSTITVTGNAFSYSGNVTLVEVSLDGGLTWYPTSDTSGNGSWSNWSYSWSPLIEGTYILKSRASGSDGSIEIPAVGAAVTVDRTPAEAIAVPPGGIYHAAISVALQTYEAAAIHFTLDGSEPTVASPVYTTPLQIAATTTVKYIASDLLGTVSAVITEEYIIDPIARWTRQIGTGTDDRAIAALDPGGNIFMVGSTGGDLDGAPGPTNINYNAFVARYSGDGERLWLHQIKTTGNDAPIGSVGVDGTGLMYTLIRTNCDLVTFVCPPWGAEYNYIYNIYNYYLVKYDADGNRVLAKMIDISGAPADSVKSYYVDAGGNSYVGGELNGQNRDYYVIKYDPDGNRQWMRQGGTTMSESVNDIVADPSGNIYLTGQTTGAFSGSVNQGAGDMFIIKLDSAGNPLWTKQFGTVADDNGVGVNVDASGNVYVSGATDGNLEGQTNSGNTDSFIMKLNVTGSHLWTRLIGTSAQEFNWRIKPVIDGVGNVFVAGETMGNLDGNLNSGGYDLYALKFDADGTRLWTKQLGTSSNDISATVMVGGDAKLYLAGTTLGGLNGNTHVGYSTSTDVFIMQVNNPLNVPSDTTPPDTAIIVRPPSVTTDRSGSLTFVATEPESTFECRLDAGSYAPCISPYNFASLAVGSHTFSVRAKDATGNTDLTPASYTWSTAARYRLTVNRGGDGGGAVSGNTTGLILGSGGISESALVIGGTSVLLVASPDGNSIFAGWSGPCEGTGPCIVPMASDRTVTASFSAKAPGTMGPVRVVTSTTASYYSSHQEALNALPEGSAPIIESSVTTATESLTLNKEAAVTLRGGYDGSYTVNSGTTTLQGSIVVAGGSLTVDGITIQ